MNTDQKPQVVIVLATYNERENVEQLLPALLGSPLDARVVIVDDGSPDGTGAAVNDIAARHPGRVALVEREGKLGYGSAFIRGFREALTLQPDIVVSMDADFSHDPHSVADLVEAASKADLAIGSRYVNGIRILNWSMRRLLLSAGANCYINFLLRFGISDCTSGFRAYRADTLRAIDLDRAGARGYAFLVEILEMVHRKKLRIVEVPITYTERAQGRSKMSRGVIFEASFHPWRLLARRLFRMK